MSLLLRAACCRPLPGRPAGYTVPYETRWQGDRGTITGTVYGDGSAHEGQDVELCIAGWGLVANAGTANPTMVSGTLPTSSRTLMAQSSSPFSCSCAWRARRRQYVTDSSFVEYGVNKRGRAATVASSAAWADLWRDVWREIDAWGGLGDSLSVRKVKAHTTAEAVLAGAITADDRAGNELADAACKLVVLEHRAPPKVRAARHSGPT